MLVGPNDISMSQPPSAVQKAGAGCPKSKARTSGGSFSRQVIFQGQVLFLVLGGSTNMEPTNWSSSRNMIFQHPLLSDRMLDGKSPARELKQGKILASLFYHDQSYPLRIGSKGNNPHVPKLIIHRKRIKIMTPAIFLE